jgi:hypothetical protein
MWGQQRVEHKQAGNELGFDPAVHCVFTLCVFVCVRTRTYAELEGVGGSRKQQSFYTINVVLIVR